MLPKEEEFENKIEYPFDILKIKDEENIFSPVNNKILLEFTKIGKKTEEVFF